MLEAIILGLIQGLTEFLPVSSSGHLVIVPYLVGGQPPPLALNVALHAGTLIAVVVFFAGDLWFLATRSFRIGSMSPDDTRRARQTVALLAVGTVPAAAAGFFLEGRLAEAFEDPRLAAAMLFVTAGLLWVAEMIRRRRAAAAEGVQPADLSLRQARADFGRNEATTTFGDAIVVGLAQALAIVPGISRSGATIAAGMARGLSREAAARFSFLLAIPVIAGAFVSQLGDLSDGALVGTPFDGRAVAAGAVAAAVAGFWAIRYLLHLVATEDLLGFARYVVVFGALTLIGSFTWLGAPGQL